MGDNRIIPKVLSYEQLRVEAGDFLDRHNPAGILPVPIEEIVEKELRLSIVLEIDLQDDCDVDAYINRHCTAIHVDERLYLARNKCRYRFSLAHETAHFILHREILSKLDIPTLARWKQLHSEIKPEHLGWIEWQAYALGGLILVPTDDLKREYSKAKDQFSDTWNDPNTKEIARFLIEDSLCDKFAVSREVIQRRCASDGLS